MKKIVAFSALIFTAFAVLESCSSNRDPGKIYMPDMAYSRAYEAYADVDTTIFSKDPKDAGRKIFYNSQPVEGTLRQGDLYPYTLPHTEEGYLASAGVKNPLGNLSPEEMEEAGRMFNIHCAICHGEKGTGNGPLGTSGKIGAIANLTLPLYVDMADGTMFHSITYGKNDMGSYASQLSREQRWRVIKYVRSLQGGGEPAAETAPADSTTAATDSTGK